MYLASKFLFEKDQGYNPENTFTWEQIVLNFLKYVQKHIVKLRRAY